MSLTLAATQSIGGMAGTGTAVTYTLLGDEITGTTDAFKVLAQGQLPTSAAALYTATGVTALVKTILLANTTASVVNVTLYINGTAAANQVASLPIPANGEAFWSDSGWVVMDSSGALLQTVGLTTDSVTNTILANMAAYTLKGNNTASTADPIDLTQAQAVKLLNAYGTTYSANAEGILPGNTAAQNVTAFNAWYAAASLFSTLIVEPGFYDFNAELTMGRDIRLRILGAGKGRSVWRSTSATAHLLNQTVAGYYISIEEMGFAVNGVTKTAGSMVRFAANNALTDVRRCEFQNAYNGIELLSSGMNIGVINECIFSSPSSTAGSDTNGAQILINGAGINFMIQNTTINVTGVSTTGLMINQCGAVQVGNCDFIGGKNTMLVNATAVVSALYFTNCFFDQATLGSTVKFMGTFAVSRTKFVQCGITNGGGSGLVALEIAGTGTGTAIPEAIDFLLCDFYNNGFAGTTTGILVTGCRGFDVRFCRIAGFTFGMDITPYNANGITNFNISGSTIGPTENFAANGTGIRLNAGSFQFGASLIVGNDLSGNTTAALVNNGTFAAGAGLTIAQNLGLAQPSTPIVATPGTITTTEAVAHQVSIPANSLLVGTTYRVKVFGTITGTTPTILARVRCGTAGTTADAQVAAMSAASAALTSATAWSIEALFTVRTIGSGGTCIGFLEFHGIGAAAALAISPTTATTAVNTTVANFLSVTMIGAGTTPVITINEAFIEVVKQ